MKPISIITFILASQLAYSTTMAKECGENEEYVTCHSSTCFDEVCEYLDKPRLCTRDCRSGCACIHDHVRGEDGKCYHKSICDM